MRYILELNEEQAKVVSTACEVFARIKMGQFNEIVWHCADKHCVDDTEEVQRLWLKLRKHIYPELIEHAGHSYGMGKFRDADLAFDVHQVIRRHFGDPREPFSHHELPRCYVESDRHSIVLDADDGEIENLKSIMRGGTPIVSVSYDGRMENGNEQ